MEGGYRKQNTRYSFGSRPLSSLENDLSLRLLWLLLVLPLAVAIACGDDDDSSGDTDGETTSTAEADDSPTEAEGEDESVFELEVGDCYNDAEEQQTEATEVEVIDCASPHDNEIYLEYSLEDGDFPGADVVLEESQERCEEEFDAFVGIAYDESDLTVFPIYPTERSWEAGDRVVYCALYASDLSKLEGTMEGAAR